MDETIKTYYIKCIFTTHLINDEKIMFSSQHLNLLNIVVMSIILLSLYKRI